MGNEPKHKSPFLSSAAFGSSFHRPGGYISFPSLFIKRRKLSLLFPSCLAWWFSGPFSQLPGIGVAAAVITPVRHNFRTASRSAGLGPITTGRCFPTADRKWRGPVDPAARRFRGGARWMARFKVRMEKIDEG